jgi:dethiobiotin synthase
VSLVVTGTDTGVGKTVVSALLMWRYGIGAGARYWKPVATGAREGSDTDDIVRWTGAEVMAEGYRFDPPVAPHVAARRAGARILPARLLRDFAARSSRTLVIEGIGGALVPLTGAGYCFADFIRSLRLPCIVVARSTLGTINHTLLTLEALRRRRVTVAGVVLNGPPNPDNRRAIERIGQVRIIAEVRPIRPMTRHGLRRSARLFDRGGLLRRHLT